MTGNGSGKLFRQKLDALAEEADVEYEAKKSLWRIGRITDEQYATAITAFTTRVSELEQMMSEWESQR
jgi:hypothetical protein